MQARKVAQEVNVECGIVNERIFYFSYLFLPGARYLNFLQNDLILALIALDEDVIQTYSNFIFREITSSFINMKHLSMTKYLEVDIWTNFPESLDGKKIVKFSNPRLEDSNQKFVRKGVIENVKNYLFIVLGYHLFILLREYKKFCFHSKPCTDTNN